ncbi:hypothetical protein LX83_000821 [Goodfellowiella coeruleoviolacea]|uniref:Uncharacterized protein n=1 Tax=Goodfellowiella coeruleoviolacea TaxID=334858 RepID=A0AAE3G955_9PSEU|nr:hypothetical protein [Goodfellowiella coeruleoviolacea]
MLISLFGRWLLRRPPSDDHPCLCNGNEFCLQCGCRCHCQ